ncbi:hypothetical protein CPB84DRAFT_1781143 [Gymnopilus junonius]|uniref:F-box domain-containing protein n=1 Tax=Gymnopilus junonius TaxID=109634 RepID=A0A9P5NLW5_GYMJU|nr:hypothetical protein CPB84DRAFT_1781143 [Gymnopilus junonius]
MAQLPDLAPELLTEILSQLSYKELLRCLRVCHLFFDVITKSSELDYHIHLQVAGMWNNSQCPIPIPTRLALLKKREKCWDFFKPSLLTKYPIPGTSSLLYDLSSTVLSHGTSPNEPTYETQGIQFLQLPFLSDDSDIESMSWDFINLGMTITEYALSIEINDLLVLVVSEVDEHEPTTINLAVVLLQYSTKKTHQLAENPVFSLCSAAEDMGIPSIGIDVSEENLAISVVFEHPFTRGAASTLCIFNWRTGKSKTDPLKYRVPVFNTSLVFLRDDILVNPNSIRNSIDIYYICPSNSISASDPPEKVVRLVHSLSLPTLQTEVYITSISCIARPNMGCESPNIMSTSKPYTSDPANAVVQFVMCLIKSNGTRQTFCMMVHRTALLDLIPLDKIEADVPGASVLQAWDAWGPPVTRWFSNTHISTAYITCISDENAGARDTIHVFNFNPAMVKLARHRKLDERILDEADIKIVDSKRSEDITCLSEGFFISDIIGKLPYVRCMSKAKWDFDEVVMSEDYLLGLKKLPNSHRMKEMTLMYFG